MKIIFIITTLLTISVLGLSTSAEYEVHDEEDISTYSIEDVINKLIQSLKDVIPEVITVASVNVELPKNKYLTGYLNVSNINLKGIKEFQADFKYLVGVPYAFALTLDSVTLNLDYLTDVALFNIPLLSIFGNGTGSKMPTKRKAMIHMQFSTSTMWISDNGREKTVTITSFAIQGNVAFTVIPINVAIKSMQIGLGDAKFTIEGLCDDEIFNNLVQKILNDNFAVLINKYEKPISTLLENIINTIIHDILSNIKPRESFENQNLIDTLFTSKGVEMASDIIVKEIKAVIN